MVSVVHTRKPPASASEDWLNYYSIYIWKPLSEVVPIDMN